MAFSSIFNNSSQLVHRRNLSQQYVLEFVGLSPRRNEFSACQKETWYICIVVTFSPKIYYFNSKICYRKPEQSSLLLLLC